MIYGNAVENEPPRWQADNVTGCACSQRKIRIET